jgi:hypothetical protein
MNAMQLLYYQAPLSALILLLLVPIFEPVTTTIAIHWTPAVVVSDQHTLYYGSVTDRDIMSMLKYVWVNNDCCCHHHHH